jgi:hypothetical protein
MYIPDHKPALAMAISSVVSYTVHAATPVIEVVQHPVFENFERWVHLIGGVGAALAGFASAAWYTYSFISAQRKKKGQ